MLMVLMVVRLLQEWQRRHDGGCDGRDGHVTILIQEGGFERGNSPLEVGAVVCAASSRVPADESSSASVYKGQAREPEPFTNRGCCRGKAGREAEAAATPECTRTVRDCPS